MTLLAGRGAACLMAALIFFMTAACSRLPSYPPARVAGGHAVVSLAELTEGMPRFFTYHFRKKTVNFFVVNNGGKVSAYLDACNKCYIHKMGYQAGKGTVTCRYCSQVYGVKELDTPTSSCWPIKLKGVQRGGDYLIPLSEIENGASKF
ncbi:MAG: Fe-S-containing protein [Actinomycetota bacterium]|nr:Fe-S-containing protein [Actinomycetota bacterium]